ncbi:2EXR domain-containing protein [Aspergillus chevalieri]|uniref:2EXR domain-containing protein n=1 Tax=Aspergillus chevalieri TaxID=182096 RepID=A0A7R7VMF0_ASPCH|nr:uncharacterized protein ACHE_31241A [Aspergillus chevalieri]BCR87254.1 hypothetical protein ACHE_31241A [Aspergillus chevalieri]
MAAKFSLFPLLPAELRTQIWQDALPDKITQPLYFYKKGCWSRRLVTEADPDYDFEDPHLNLNFEFRHELLDDVEFEVPLFYVNREARGFALAWVREQGLKIQFQNDKGCLVFIRAFDPKHDTLYVPLNKWDEFCREPFDRTFEPDLVERNVNCPAPAFTRIAVSEVLLGEEINPLCELFDYYVSIQEVFVVVDAPPDLDIQPEENSEDDGERLQRRWEIESGAMGARFCWDNDRGEFEWADREGFGDKVSRELIEDATNGISEKLVENGRRRFEVRPVLAFRK